MPNKRQMLRALLIDKTGNRCMLCGDGPLEHKSLKTALKHPDQPEVLENLIVCCLRCRSDKGDEDIKTYIDRRIVSAEREVAILHHLQGKF